MNEMRHEAIQILETLIQGRRSIRKYKSDPVPKDIVEKLLNLGTWAPSGKNYQNWRFFVLTGEKRNAYLKYNQKSWLGIKDQLQKKLKPSLYAFTERFFFTLGEAPIFILCYSKSQPDERYLTSVGSVYMAVQNILLAAQALGLATCPMGAPLEIKEEIDAFIGKDLVQGMELLCGITLGYPDHSPPAAPRQTEGRITWIE